MTVHRSALLVALQWLRARRSPGGLEAAGPAGHVLNLAVPNWLLRRDDQVGCAVFWPIDRQEQR